MFQKENSMEKWVVSAKKADFKKISEQFGIDPVTARIIRNREVIGEEAIEEYLHGTLKDLQDPEKMKDMKKAVSILKEKIQQKKKIRIIGDYDIDGVHFDYLRYPENAPLFPDKYDFRRYGKGRTVEQWRRDNISEIVRYIYKGVKAIKPWVKLSASPVGKYRDTSRYPSRGWNAFHTVYQDPQGWLGEGIMDQIYPMMYFQGNSFYPFALDWQEQSNGRQVIPGLGIYFLHPDEGKWTRDEIDRQMNFIRSHKLAGEAHYRVKYLMENTQGIYDELAENFYAYPALQPPMPWLDNVPPTAPTELKVTDIDHGYTELKWQAATDNDPHNNPMYVIYASNEYPVDTSRPENIVAQNIRETSYIYAPILPWNAKKHFAVTAVDRYGNESVAVQK